MNAGTYFSSCIVLPDNYIITMTDDYGDGWDDGLDAFPGDSRFWSDSDGDSYPDQIGYDETDDCPDLAGTSTSDLIGCPDSDGDGWSDSGDVFPNNADLHSASSNSLYIGLIGLFVFSIIISSLVIVMKRQSKIPSASQTSNPSQSPPLPPEGLPPGWTIEQWHWYGEDYLQNR